MQKQKKILFLAYNLRQGGAERQLYYILRLLLQLGFNPTVVTFKEDGFWEGIIKSTGTEVKLINSQNKLDRLIKLIKFVYGEKYDFIHSQQFGLNLYSVIAAWFNNSISIGSIRNDCISEVHDVGVLGWLSLMLPSKIVANSKLGMKNAINIYKRKNIGYLPNLVETDVYTPEKPSDLHFPFKVITVGTVWLPKRIDRVISIAEYFSQHYDEEVIFEIIGDGEQLDEMVALAKGKGLLGGLVNFKPRTENILTVYQNANALLLVSDHEGTPNVVLEAMACGLPVVASAVGEVPELVIDGVTGFKHLPDDITGMAQSVKKLAEDPELCKLLGSNGRSMVVENYSLRSLKERLLLLYTDKEYC